MVPAGLAAAAPFLARAAGRQPCRAASWSGIRYASLFSGTPNLGGAQVPSAADAAVAAFDGSEVAAGERVLQDPTIVKTQQKFSKAACGILQAPLNVAEIAVRGDGIKYLPEMRYRNVLNKAFGPGGWAMVPLGPTMKRYDAYGRMVVWRDWAMFVHGRCVSSAMGKCDTGNFLGVENAAEAAKSNALMRCCKDLGVASELWDPIWVKKHGSRF